MLCTPENPTPLRDVVLVHGVFGSGKSYLLAVLILFLIRVFDASDEEEGMPVR